MDLSFLVSLMGGLPRRNDGNLPKEFWTACCETQVGASMTNECHPQLHKL